MKFTSQSITSIILTLGMAVLAYGGWVTTVKSQKGVELTPVLTTETRRIGSLRLIFISPVSDFPRLEWSRSGSWLGFLSFCLGRSGEDRRGDRVSIVVGPIVPIPIPGDGGGDGIEAGGCSVTCERGIGGICSRISKPLAYTDPATEKSQLNMEIPMRRALRPPPRRRTSRSSTPATCRSGRRCLAVAGPAVDEVLAAIGGGIVAALAVHPPGYRLPGVPMMLERGRLHGRAVAVILLNVIHAQGAARADR